ncbi:MAG: DEAD/DEAH box helicase [Sandaracinaceae bacterium]|nr:DEAD/DEAH box helicase [Sandaracinaceae bacterium]
MSGGGNGGDAFDRLSGALQYQIVNTLGWPALRPVQLHTIDAVLGGENCVVLAPTAGGKTEASFFPVLSAMDDEDWRPVSVIYLSPIRALLNNQEERVSYYAGLIGRRAFKWHGDVTASARKKFLADPADILLTTPESLEAMMMGTKVPTRELFAGLRAVIVDEIHAFADDDRGAHLSAVLERLSRYCGRDVQRIGLSATVGNPDAILRWVQGSSKRPGRIVNPGGAKKTPDISLDYVGSMENAAVMVERLHPGRKRLVFVDSRRQAEQLGKLLSDRDVLTYVTHGSLSVTERRDAERAFHEGSDCVIVATSALELGIDVGDLDHVLQIDSPPSVASFLQRMGRTGRRSETRPNCTFLCTKDSSVLQAAAIIQLNAEGFVEPVKPHRRAAHIYAHQIMALSIQLGGVPPGDIDAWLNGATAFIDLSAEERASVIEHMLTEEILALRGGRYHLGPAGEKPYGSGNFRNLYAVFDAPRLIHVRWDTRDIGTVDAKFLMTLCSEDTPATFTLAARAWVVAHVDWERGVCIVRPALEGRAARWAGSPQHLSYELCQAMKRILMDVEVDPTWSSRAQNVLATQRAEHGFLVDGPLSMIEGSDEITLWTFAGGAANVLLARMIEKELGEKVISRNTSLTLKGDAGKSAAAVHAAFDAWRAEGRPTEGDARVHAEGAVRGRVSKFQLCLPEALLLDLLVNAAVDVEGARKVVEPCRA